MFFQIRLNCRINITHYSSTFSTYVIAYSTIEGNATNREPVSTTTSGGEVSEPGISKLQSKLNKIQGVLITVWWASFLISEKVE